MKPRSAAFSAIMWAVTIVVIVGAIVGVGWWLRADQASPAPATQAAAQGPTPVTVGRDYYFFVRLVEFTPLSPRGKQWDIDGSAPDAEVHLTWRGNRTFALPQRGDQLIARWDLFRVDVKDVVISGKTDISSMINGPIIRVMPNETIAIEVVDGDIGPDDVALKMEIPLARLHEGHNDLAIPEGSGVSRLWIDMIDCATPLADLIKLQTGGGT